MATDIVERLHDFDMRREFSHVRNPDICGEAADVIAALRARVAELEAGITKFLHETAGPVGRLAARVPDRHDGAIGTDIFCVQAGYPFLRAVRDGLPSNKGGSRDG